MDKKYIQGVVPPTHKRSIRNIPIPTRERRGDIEIEKKDDNFINKQEEDIPPVDNNDEDIFNDFDDKPKKSGKGKKTIILISVLVILLIVFWVVSSFDSATIKIIPKTETSSFEERLMIEDLSSRKNNESLGYRVIELSQQLSSVAKAIDEELVQEKASGKITIYNEYSDQPQRLIKNTRFESADGKIYRIDDSVSVPGYTGSGDSINPGEITVTVYADEVGEEYNINSSKFKIPGFEGQEPYDFFYAETNTAINGGYDGVRKIVSDEDIENKSQELKQNLKEKLLSELNNEVNEEFYSLYDDNSFVYDDITQESVENSDDVELIMRGKIVAKVFNKNDMSNSIADNIFANYFTNEKTLIEDFGSLEIELSSEEESDQEYLNIKGDNSKFVWQIDDNQLKKDLVGKDVKSLSNIMENYTEIKNAEASFKPFWKSKYPDKEKDIKIEIVE